MKVTIKVDTTEIQKQLRAFPDEIRSASRNAINDTARLFQKEQVQEMSKNFTIRRAGWVQKSIKLKPLATKERLSAIVSVTPPGANGEDRADILAQHEETPLKKPQDGHRLAVPTEQVKKPKQVLSNAKRPRSFDFTLTGKKGGVEVYQGDKRTFMVKKADGTGGIYQRTASAKNRTKTDIAPLSRDRKGRFIRRFYKENKRFSTGTDGIRRDKGIRTLFRFTPQAKLDRRLKFYHTANRVVRAEFPKTMKEAIDHAISRGLDKKRTTSHHRIAKADVLGSDRES